MFPFTLSSTCYSQIEFLIKFWLVIRERYKLNISYACPWKPQYKSTWEVRGRGEESCVSVAASSGRGSKQTRLVVAHHPRGCPCICPSPKSSQGLVSTWRAWGGSQVSQGKLKLDCGLTSGKKQNEMSNAGWPHSRNVRNKRWSGKNAACHILRGKLLASAASGWEWWW